MLELEPVRLKVIRHVRPKLACASCDTIVQAPAPTRPIERGMAGPGLLAHVIVGKYADHVPLYRQAEIYAREGVELDRTLLAQWVGSVSALLTPLTDALRAHVFAADVVHADDTPLPVLAPGLGKTKTGRLWTYVRDERPAAGEVAPAVWFAYSPDRKGEHPQRHLEGFSGILQADGYAGFSKIYDGGRVLEAACWAHVRRKFVDLHELHQSPVAAQALDRIGALYAIEQEIRGRRPHERCAVRQERSRPLLDSMKAWLEQTRGTLSQKSAAAKAISYALSRWQALGRYCDDGRIEIDNNAAERALRGVALGRNYAQHVIMRSSSREVALRQAYGVEDIGIIRAPCHGLARRGNPATTWPPSTHAEPPNPDTDHPATSSPGWKRFDYAQRLKMTRSTCKHFHDQIGTIRRSA
jgi:transposase